MKLPTILAGGLALLVVGASSAAAQSAPAPQTVAIDNFAFAPAEISVSTGTTISWANKQTVRHTSTADNGEWDSGILTNNQTFETTFDQVGDFAYHCDIHPDMVGVVHVTAPVAVDAPVAIEAPAASVAIEPIEQAIAADPQPAPAAPVVAPTAAPTAVPTAAPAPTPAPIVVPTLAPTPQRGYYGY